MKPPSNLAASRRPPCSRVARRPLSSRVAVMRSLLTGLVDQDGRRVVGDASLLDAKPTSKLLVSQLNMEPLADEDGRRAVGDEPL